MKDIVINKISDWFSELVDSIKDGPLQKIVLIFISPFLIHAMAEALADFSWFTMVGYYVACIYGFSKILDDPYRIVKWGAGYAIAASVTPLILSSVWPEIKQGTYLSIFSGLVILYVVVMIWLRARDLKKS